MRVRGSESACTCERQKGPYPPPASPNMPTAAPAPASTQPAAPHRPAQPTAHRRTRRISAAKQRGAHAHRRGAWVPAQCARARMSAAHACVRACVRLPRRRCDTLRTPAHRCAATRSPARADAADNTPRFLDAACRAAYDGHATRCAVPRRSMPRVRRTSSVAALSSCRSAIESSMKLRRPSAARQPLSVGDTHAGRTPARPPRSCAIGQRRSHR